MPVLLVIVGSTRPGRVGLPIARWFEEVAVAHGEFDVAFADLAEVALPLFDEPNHPMLAQYEHAHTKRWSAIVAQADAIVFVVPEYNHGYNAATKNAIDSLYREWNHKAVGFVSYGGASSGMRAVEQLKPIAACVKMVPVGEVNVSLFNVPVVDGQLQNTDGIAFAAKALLGELLRWNMQLRALRA
ncbi:MAG: NADPH-dependent FMN reductase [Actinobacteria bacterium]|nr:NADPH-dependent FMN reductase [Actinomycetota bacterium]